MSSFLYRHLRRFHLFPTLGNIVSAKVVGAVLCGALALGNTAAHAQLLTPLDETEDGEAIAANAAPNYNAAPTIGSPTLNESAADLPSTRLASQQLASQQAERQNRIQENNIRNLMRSMGVSSREMQDMVLLHITSETQAREPMRAASGRLLQAMRTPGYTEAQLSVLLNDCRVSFDTDKARRFDALTTLKAKIGPDLSPRMESMILLLGLEGDVIITLPSPTMLSQMQRERQQLLRMVDGLKLEADSLRRERDDMEAERDTFARPVVPNSIIRSTASAQINPNSLNGSYAAPDQKEAPILAPFLSAEQKELAQLRADNARMKKENQRLQNENTFLRRGAKEETSKGKEAGKDVNKAENKQEKR